MAELVQCLGWDAKGYPMDMPRSGKPPKLRIASYTKAEQDKWEASIDNFEQRQSNFMKQTLKGKPSKTWMTACSGKEMYWVGLAPYTPDYTNRRRHLILLGVETDAGDNDDEENNGNDEANWLSVCGGGSLVVWGIYVGLTFPKIKQWFSVIW